MEKHCTTCESATCHHISHFSFLIGALAFAVVFTGISGMYLVRESKTAVEKPIYTAPASETETAVKPESKPFPIGAITTLSIIGPENVRTSLVIAE